MEAVLAALPFTIGFFVGGALAGVILLAILGYALKGDMLAYFFVEPNLFDAEDITAMQFSVHKSLLRALDATGIDTSKLRLKQEFKGGRKSEVV
mgnify:CR=1 FL=1